jgi:hypothetical protein
MAMVHNLALHDETPLRHVSPDLQELVLQTRMVLIEHLLQYSSVSF